MDRIALFTRAADMLDEDATCLEESHTRADGSWDLSDPVDERAKADCDERRKVAACLRLLVDQ